MTRQGWTRLGELVRRTISNIERASKDNYDPSTIDAIEIAMRWQVGSVDRVVNGQGPIPERMIEDELTQRLREAWVELSPDAREAVVRIVELLARS